MSPRTRKFLIATHGAFARGILSSLEMITGSTENVFTLQAYLEGNQSIEEELGKIVNPENNGEEWVIFSDLLGGSITNQLLRQVAGEHIHIVAGVNLPLLIEIVLADTDTPLAEVIEGAVGKAREQLVYVNPLISLKKGDH